MGSLGTLPDPLDINDRTDTTITAADEIVYADATDSAAIKKDTVQGILDLAAVADNAITLAKMASGTDGNIISYDASGDPVAIATGSDGQVLTSTGAGSPPAFEALPGGGKVLQTIQVEKNDYFTTTSASLVAVTGFTVNITPSATSSKVLILVTCTVGQSTAGQNGGLVLFRDSTQIHVGDAAGSRTRLSSATDVHAAYAQDRVSMAFLDSPSSTSQVTYLLKAISTSTSYTLSVGGPSYTEDAAGRARLPGSIIVQEIGA